jgi:hypothetical protein
MMRLYERHSRLAKPGVTTTPIVAEETQRRIGIEQIDALFGAVILGVCGATIGAIWRSRASTWAMLLLGFAGLGFAGYRRARSNTTAFAST